MNKAREEMMNRLKAIHEELGGHKKYQYGWTNQFEYDGRRARVYVSNVRAANTEHVVGEIAYDGVQLSIASIYAGAGKGSPDFNDEFVKRVLDGIEFVVKNGKDVG